MNEIAALITAVAALIAAVVGGVVAIIREMRTTREVVNGHLAKMIAVAISAGHAEGKVEEREEQDARDAAVRNGERQ